TSSCTTEKSTTRIDSLDSCRIQNISPGNVTVDKNIKNTK
ncbi:MAG: hypothetical protein ACI8RD_005625, partial [Bacillariaceae sp.]